MLGITGDKKNQCTIQPVKNLLVSQTQEFKYKFIRLNTMPQNKHRTCYVRVPVVLFSQIQWLFVHLHMIHHLSYILCKRSFSLEPPSSFDLWDSSHSQVFSKLTGCFLCFLCSLFLIIQIITISSNHHLSHHLKCWNVLHSNLQISTFPVLALVF